MTPLTPRATTTGPELGAAYVPPRQPQPVPAPVEPDRARRHAALRLVAYSSLILFFELALIRYTASYVRVFGFYSNFVLIAAFLGMGVGLLRADAAERLKWLAVPASLLLVGAVVYLSRMVIAVPQGPAEHFWTVFEGGGREGVPLLLAVVGLFGLCTVFFVPDRKSTRLNSSHANISYAVFCLKKKKTFAAPVFYTSQHDAV